MSSPAPGDLGAALQNLVTSIVNAITALLTGFAQWIQQNAGLVATIVGFSLLATLAISAVTGYGGRLTAFFRGLLRI